MQNNSSRKNEYVKIIDKHSLLTLWYLSRSAHRTEYITQCCIMSVGEFNIILLRTYSIVIATAVFVAII